MMNGKITPIVRDLIRFLDNVLQFFIDNAPDTLERDQSILHHRKDH